MRRQVFFGPRVISNPNLRPTGPKLGYTVSARNKLAMRGVVMQRKRIFLLLCFLLSAAFTFWASANETRPGSVTTISPGVWFRQGELEAMGHCNNIIIEMKDYLIVVDANFPSGARLTLDDAKKLSGKPVRYVFDTHHHGDHAYGNPVWTRAGATTLAHVGVAEEMERYEPQRWREAAQGRPGLAELNLPTAEPPRQTFRQSPFILEDETRRVEFHFFGWAHTRGDGFVFLPKERILCTGDAIVNGPLNYTGDGNTLNWPNVIRAAQRLDVERVLPGHGSPGGRDLMDGQLRFFRELTAAVQSAVDAGRKIEDITTQDNGRISTSIRLSDKVSNWVGDRLGEQVTAVYKEITLGKPHGELLGGK